MNRDDIIKLAREADINVDGDVQGCLLRFICVENDLERFAALVAAAEHEKVAAWMMQRGFATGHGDTVDALLNELEWQVAEREREACAKVCKEVLEQYRGTDMGKHAEMVGDNCAAAIRERGQG